MVTAFLNNTAVEVLDAFDGLAVVRALEGQPFVGGTHWPVRTALATVRVDQLHASPDDGECTCRPDKLNTCPACIRLLRSQEESND